MKRKNIISIILIIMMVLGISMIGYAFDGVDYTGYKDFLVATRLVYSPVYSDMFRPTETGACRLVIDGNDVLHSGDLLSGAEICNSDGTPMGSRPVCNTKTVSDTGVIDEEYSFSLSGSASYKAFLEPENGLHITTNIVTIWYD